MTWVKRKTRPEREPARAAMPKWHADPSPPRAPKPLAPSDATRRNATRHTRPPMPDLFGLDAYAPREIAARVRDIGVTKARLPLTTQLLLGVLAGAFIGLGSMMFTLVASDASLGFAASRLIGGIAFSLGLFMVVVAGAELFTGNNLLAMAWASGRITSIDLLRNWFVVALANLAGAVGLAVLVWLADHAAMNDGAVARAAVRIATTKAQLPWEAAFFRGVLCNVLVCMAVWMAMAARGVTDKLAAVVLPVTAFVAAGFEHSIANMYFFPLAMLLGAPIGVADALRNLAVVIAGNIVGGSVLVALVYWLIYLRPGEGRDGPIDG
jgi:formate transporter